MSQNDSPTSFSFDAIGTHWIVECFSKIDGESLVSMQHEIANRVETFDKHYSRFRSDSLVATMSQQAGEFTLPDDAEPMLDLYRKLYEITEGAVTPLIGSTMSAAGYDAEYSLQPGNVQAPASWQDTLVYNFPLITLKQPASLDFGAAGKGYLVDIVATIVRGHGVAQFCVNGGGDIFYESNEGSKLDVGLEHPADPTMAIGVAQIHNQSICGSSGNRRTWGSGDSKYHHIINPHTLQSPRHIQALWVVAETALLADGLSTALFFVDADVLRKHYNFEYAIVAKDFSLQHSKNFPATFFTNDDPYKKTEKE